MVSVEHVEAEHLQAAIQIAKDLGKRILAVSPSKMRFRWIGLNRTAEVLEYVLVTQ